MARAVRTWAIASGRSYVTPDDVRDLAIPVLAHRVVIDAESDFAGVKPEDVIERILLDVAPPAYRAA
jgi:MoxR-like ATPase